MGLLDKAAVLAAKTKFVCIDKAPELHFIAGTVMMVATVVSAAKKSLSFEEIKKERRETVKDCDREIDEKEEIKDKEGEKKKVRRKIRIAFIYQTLKNWLPTAILGFLSVFLYGKGFGIMKGRLITIGGVCASLATENEQLREKLNGSKNNTEEVSGEEITYGENGEVVEEKEETEELGRFQRYFGPENPNFEKNNRAKNRYWLQKKIDYLRTMRFDMKKYLFLNEALNEFNFKKDDAGQIFGWAKYDDPNIAKKYGGANDVFITVEDANDGIGYIVTFHVDKMPLTGRIKW